MPTTPKQFKYHTSFAAELRCPISKKTSQFLAKASIDELKVLLPAIAQEEGWDDLLPIAGNACVVNLANKNRDGINTAAALAIAPYFADKFIDAEHDRNFIIGFIKNYAFSRYSPNFAVGASSEILAAEDAAKMTEPFNMALGGIVWRVVAPLVADKIEDCNNPSSPDYLTLSISWELGFDSYSIAVGPPNLSECKVYTDPSEVEAMSKYLIQNGGPGELEDGTPVYRLITETSGATPLGIGLTFAPAASVAGVITQAFETRAKEIKEKLSHSNTPPVINTKATKTIPLSMKTLTSLAEVLALNDETKAEFSVANLKNIISAETTPIVDLEKTVREYQEKLDVEKRAKEDAVKNATEAASKASSDIATLNTKLENLQNQYAELLDKQTEAEATSKFNERMTSINADYDLDDAQRQSIAESIRGLDDTTFATWLNNFANFASKSKKVAVVEKTDEEKKAEAAAALKNTAKKVESTAAVLSNQPTDKVPTLVEKMRGAFSKDNMKVSGARK